MACLGSRSWDVPSLFSEIFLPQWREIFSSVLNSAESETAQAVARVA
jgi:hypothetical protein